MWRKVLWYRGIWGSLKPMTMIERPDALLSVAAVTEHHRRRNRATTVSAKMHGELLVWCAHQEDDHLSSGVEEHCDMLVNLRQPSHYKSTSRDSGPRVRRAYALSLGQASGPQAVEEILTS